MNDKHELCTMPVHNYRVTLLTGSLKQCLSIEVPPPQEWQRTLVQWIFIGPKIFGYYKCITQPEY